jgi:hypothetical protein
MSDYSDDYRAQAFAAAAFVGKAQVLMDLIDRSAEMGYPYQDLRKAMRDAVAELSREVGLS